MNKQVRKILASHALTGFIMWYGVEKVFQKTIGITVLQVSLLAITYIAVSALFNVPTGVLADKFGRKYAIAFAASALLLCSLSAGLSHNVWQYLISIILWGIFYTTQNGAYEAILYDTLKEQGKEDKYARYSGLSNAFFWVAIFISSVIGAYIGSRTSLRWPYFLTLIPNAFNIMLALSLREPKRAEYEEHTSPFAVAKKGFKFLLSSRKIISLATIYLLITLYGWTTNEFGQLYFIELGFAVFAVGLANASSGLFQSFGNFLGHKFRHLPQQRLTILMILIFLLVFLIPIRFKFSALAGFLLFVFLRQIFYIVNNTELQHSVPSNIRATVLSSIGMLSDAILIGTYLGFGLISQHFSVRAGYLFVGLLGIVLLAAGRLTSINIHSKDPAVGNAPLAEPIVEIDSEPR